jgi:hypothetical protein
MSIATLKRKSQTQYNNMSVGMKGFSLNGTFRGQGYVGQSTQSRTLVRSLVKGSTLRGHGGCCGKYPIQNVKASELLHLDDGSAHRSVMNTNGMILSKYRWARRPQPFSTFKLSGSDRQTYSQSTYIDNLVKNQLNDMKNNKCKPQYVCKMPCRPIGARSFKTIVPIYKAVKDETATGAVTQSSRLRALDAACGLIDKKLIQETTRTAAVPFACKQI